MTGTKGFTRLLCIWVAVLHVTASTLLAVGPVQAQAVDDPPVIDLQLVETGTLGDSQVFSATVTDNNGVADVVLYYRLMGESEYANTPMFIIPGTSIYTVTLDINSEEETAVEYYVSASDNANNRSVTGFAFDPLTRVLIASDQLAGTTEPAPAQTEPVAAPKRAGLSTGRKLLYGALAVLAVGAIAAAASGGGGSSSGGSSEAPGGGPTIPVVITVDTIASEFD